MLRLKFQRWEDRDVEYRDIASVNNPQIARQAVEEWQRAVRHARENGRDIITLTFNGEAIPVVIDTREKYKVEWEYISD